MDVASTGAVRGRDCGPVHVWSVWGRPAHRVHPRPDGKVRALTACDGVGGGNVWDGTACGLHQRMGPASVWKNWSLSASAANAQTICRSNGAGCRAVGKAARQTSWRAYFLVGAFFFVAVFATAFAAAVLAGAFFAATFFAGAFLAGAGAATGCFTRSREAWISRHAAAAPS